MPLVSAPFFDLNSQYRPNRFITEMTSVNPLVLCQVSVVVDSIGVTSIIKSPYFSFGNTYYFEFDVAKILQVYSAPKSQNKTTVIPNTPRTPYNTSNTDIHTRVGVIVSYYYLDPTTGLLTQFVTIDTIPTDYPAIAGTRQTADWNDMSYNDFIMDLAYAGSDQRRYMTNRPNPEIICRSTKDFAESSYLTFVPKFCNAFRVTTYDSSGLLIESGLASITPNANLVPTTIGVGMANLQTQTYFSGAVNMNNTSIDTYTIEIGTAYMLGMAWVFQTVSQVHTIKVKECCGDRAVRLHWVNRLGGADAYTFTSKKKIIQKTKSETAQKPLGWGYTLPPATSYDKGRFKIQQEVIKEYEVESTFYTEQEGEWISELLSSPEVYLETRNGFVAVVIEESSITIMESDALINVSITFSEANYISVQSN